MFIKRTVFEILDFKKKVMTLKPGLGVTPGHRNRYRSATCDFLLTFYIAAIGLSRTVSEINGDFCRKSQIFPTFVLRPRLRVPLGIWYQRWGQKTRMIGLPGKIRSLTISSAMWTQYINVTDRQTDGETDRRTPDDSKDHANA